MPADPAGATLAVAAEPSPPEQVFTRLSDAFDAAIQNDPSSVTCRWYRLAGRPVRVRTVGEDLGAASHRPMVHLFDRAEDAERVDSPDDPRPAALTIDLWDEAATGVGCAGCEPGADLSAQAEFTASPDNRFVLEERAQVTAAFDRKERRIIAWVGDAGRLTRYEMGRPLHGHLLLWHRDRGVRAVHSGLVSRDGDGVLLGGAGGSGKSTVSLTCLEAGFSYLADDYVGLERTPSAGGYTGYSLYASTAVDPTHLRRCFPRLLDLEIPGILPHEDKSLVFLSDIFPERLARQARVRAIALPRVTGEPSTVIRPASSFEALLRLAPSSMFGLPHSANGNAGLAELSDFVEAVPAFWLDLGTDLSEIPTSIDWILENARAP